MPINTAEELERLLREPETPVRITHDGRVLRDDEAAKSVTIPLDLLADLWRYGNLAPVEGVLYAKSHRDRLREADDYIRRAYET